MRIPHRMALAAAATTPLLLLTPPAHAAGGGYAAFAGFLTLPTVPCTTSCNAAFNSTVAVGQAVSGTNALVVTTLSAAFTYTYPCSITGPYVWRATGTMTLSGVGSALSASFAWTLVGTEAVITSGGGGMDVVGTAEVVPLDGVPICGVPTSRTYLVSGRVALVGT